MVRVLLNASTTRKLVMRAPDASRSSSELNTAATSFAPTPNLSDSTVIACTYSLPEGNTASVIPIRCPPPIGVSSACNLFTTVLYYRGNLTAVLGPEEYALSTTGGGYVRVIVRILVMYL